MLKGSVWAAMNYAPPRGRCNHKTSLMSPACPCLRFMLHPIKVHLSFPGFLRSMTDIHRRQHQASSVTDAATMPRSILWRILPRTLSVRSGWTKKRKPRSSKLQWARARSARCSRRMPSMKTNALWWWMSLTNPSFASMPERAEARRPELGDGNVCGTTRYQHSHEFGLLPGRRHSTFE
jgi:hypothetical protein